MRFEKCYFYPYFATYTEWMKSVLDEPYILLTDKKIGLVQDLLPVLKQIARTGMQALGAPLMRITENAGASMRLSWPRTSRAGPSVTAIMLLLGITSTCLLKALFTLQKSSVLVYKMRLRLLAWC